METFKLVSEHYSAENSNILILGENNGKYEVRDGSDEPFTLYNTFENYHEAHAFAEKEVEI